MTFGSTTRKTSFVLYLRETDSLQHHVCQTEAINHQKITCASRNSIRRSLSMYMRIMQRAVLSSASNCVAPFSCRFYSTKASKPLRILFCGSDDFSSASLQALHEEQKRDSQLIRSIDVLCRPGKPYGRSLKTIRDGTELSCLPCRAKF
jgi:hypothetical protein